MSPSQINTLLKRYVKGRCTANEAQVVEDWLAKNWKENEEWQYMNDSSRKQWLSYLYGDVQKSIRLKEKKILHINHIADLRRWKLISSVAAILLVVCGLYFTRSLENWINPVSYQVSVASGKPKKLVLADGTHLWLNSGSSLRYPNRFNGKKREVYLEGEAYFEVTHNTQSPFIVHTGKIKTRVLGTIFNITAYKKNPQIKVILFSGKVEVTKENNPKDKETNRLILLPRQLARYQKESGKLVKTTISNMDQYSGWKEGMLIFDETPMLEVLERLSTTYNVKFILKDNKISECKITGSFDVNQKLEEILKSISVSIGGKYTKKAANLFFIKKDVPNRILYDSR